MALHNPIITLDSVSQILPDRFSITLRLVIPDNDVTAIGIDKTYTLQMKAGSGTSSNNQAFKDMMNEDIKQYKKTENLWKNANWLVTTTAIKDGLVI